MYLKEISASGFKSFADKLDITLDDKITCIVGPNGSGKSNIVDAVRWVLGEQSVKSLRGDNTMSDIIFSGSKTRNPLNVASVSLTFDNSDNYINYPYNEICIKRRVYKTGENEYFLNGEKCRLKDLTDLFLDSGVNKESYNIISQGEIGKILSNSPYERRTIFESAAGVLKYKKRKEEAVRKLDKTHNNLDRVNDIIGELEIQVEPLRVQSEKAREYLDYKEQLESIEIALIAYEIDSINYDYEVAKKKQEELKNKILDINLKNTNSDTELIELKNELAKLDEEISKMNTKLLELTKKEEKLNGDKNLLQERSKYDASDDKVHRNVSNLKEEVLKTENAIFLLNKDIENLNKDKDELNTTLSKLELDYNNYNSKRSDIFNDRTAKGLELIDINHKIEVLTNNIESGGNLSSSVKAVLNNPRLSGIHQVIGNLVETTDEYVKALEVSVMSNRQFIVVDDDVSAKIAINYLKENKLGRATFFPLSVIKPRGVDSKTIEIAKSDDGYIDTLINLIKYDSIYYNVIANQFGNILVAKDIDAATRISKKINQTYRVVTLAGDVINVGGSMSGGSISVGKSIITEKRELDFLKRRKEELNAVIKELDNSLEEYDKNLGIKQNFVYEERKKVIVNEELLKTKEEELKVLNIKFNDIQTELSNLSSVIDSSVSKEEEKLMKEYYEVSREKEELIKDIKIVNKNRDNLNVKLEELTAINKLNNSDLNKCEKELKELEINTSKMDVKLDNYIRILSEEYELTYEKARESHILDMDPDDARVSVNKCKNEIRKLGMVNINAIEDYKRVSERYEFLSTQRNDLLHAKETLLEIIEEMDQVMKDEFLSTFEKIRDEFQKVFKDLFKGGHADLKLTDPDNILETGVEIVASPPGKKLTSVTLLSGGEKTLTAISLVFAILNIRTIPFCIFDEIEAALDEANVDNFGEYLKNYRNKTQFLIITHKKRTMEYADTLYGITMQESGVSKLVSVKLSTIEE